MTTTQTTQTYWMNDGGEVSCPKHLGYSATSELEANPKARRLYTGPNSWERMTKTDLADWLEFLNEQGYNEACETCRHNAGATI